MFHDELQARTKGRAQLAHQRRRLQGCRPWRCRCGDRQGQGDDHAHDRPHSCAAPGNHELPHGRHGFDPGRLRRHRRQEPGSDDKHGPYDQNGQTHVESYTKPLLAHINAGDIDPSFVVTHPASLEDAPQMYAKFRNKEDGVIKFVLRPRL
jgi:hypothetical protein